MTENKSEVCKNAAWDEFRNAGLLWWVNRSLHIFGWTIICEITDDKTINCYPARTKWRGFSRDDEKEGFIKLSTFIKEKAAELDKEINNSHDD